MALHVNRRLCEKTVRANYQRDVEKKVLGQYEELCASVIMFHLMNLRHGLHQYKVSDNCGKSIGFQRTGTSITSELCAGGGACALAALPTL
jgi:hypothetical protein